LYINHVYEHLLSDGSGFRGSDIHDLGGDGYDKATIANTYSALCILVMLGDDLNKLDKEEIMTYLKKCQLKDGSFKALLDTKGNPTGDGDLRQCYMATSIRKILKYTGLNDIELESIVLYVLKQRNFDGGLGNGESHAGLTFCGLATLKLIDRLDPNDWTKTLDWLIHRQISFHEWNQELLNNEDFDDEDQGGFNGRINKMADTCYAFWCVASLSLLGKEYLIDEKQMEKYLLNQTQNPITGGFAKTEVDDPDPYHSFLGLGALSLVCHTQLKRLEPSLVIIQDAYDRLK
jgi:geranylgeranyl transferase type-1 subunit beta